MYLDSLLLDNLKKTTTFEFFNYDKVLLSNLNFHLQLQLYEDLQFSTKR